MKNTKLFNKTVQLLLTLGFVTSLFLVTRLSLDKVYSRTPDMESKKIRKENTSLVSLDSGYYNELGEGDTSSPIDSVQDSQSIRILSLRDVTKLALENSLDIQIAQYDAYIQRVSLQKTESIFDAFLNAQVEYRRDRTMPPTTFIGEETIEHTYSMGIEKKMVTGTTLAVDISDVKNKSDNPFSTLNPYHEALLGVTITHPLARNFFGIQDRSQLEVARINVENMDYTSLDKIEYTLYSVQRAYWKLVFKSEELSIKKDMLKEAEKLYRIYKDKYATGLVEKSELLAVEALVRTREADVAIALLEKETTKNDLLFLLNLGDFQQMIEPKDHLFCETKTVDLYTVLQRAIEARRDYKRIQNEIEKNKIIIAVKKNALWPQIDLEASFTRNNLATKRSKAWEDIGSKSNDKVTVGLRFKLPLENREAKAELEEAKLKKRRLLLMLKRVERVILQKLNNKVNQVNTMHNQVKLFESTVKIHQQKLEEEITRLRQGRSNADILIRYEEDLLKARLSLASYLFQYRVSLIELELAQNTLLKKYWDNPL